MNSLTFNGTWKEVQGKLKQRYGALARNDLVYEEGRQEQLLGRLQKAAGKTQDEVRKIIADL